MINASSAEMLYHIDEQLSIISEYLTIEPGDIRFTDSPSGSAGVHGDRNILLIKNYIYFSCVIPIHTATLNLKK